MAEFRGKRFTDERLFALPSLPRLKSLALVNTAVTDAGIEALSVAEKLKSLMVFDAPGITDEAMEYIGQLANLTELYLEGTSISDRGLAHITTLSKLWSVSLNSTHVSDLGLQHLGKIRSLVLLSARDTKIAGNQLTELSHIQGLNIYLAGCPVSDDALIKSIPNMPRLRRIDLSHTSVTDDGAKCFAQCLLLEDLRLSNTQVSDDTLQYLESHPKLDVLYVENTQVTSGAVERLRKKRPQLTVYYDLRFW